MSLLPLYRSLLKGIHAAKSHPHHLQDIRFILSYPHVDSSDVVRVCCDDLRRALLLSAPPASPPRSAVAQKFINMRELVWLKARLEKITSEATQTILREAEMVASELSESDFLSDEIFDEKSPDMSERQQQQRQEVVGVSESVSHSNDDVGMMTCGVASAGAIGRRKEMFVLRHVAPFPLAKEYLSSFNLDSHTVSTAAGSNAQLVEFVRGGVPRRVECHNEDLTLAVSVRLFDETLAGKQAENDSPFAAAHRSFMLKFVLRPHDNSTACIDVVNSYFLRLDVSSSELLEDVGYVHAAHVWKALQGSDGDNTVQDKDKSCSPSQFELCFVNPTHNPMVMKGQLYYTLRTDDTTPASELPLRVISFGHLLLFNGP